MKFVAAALAAAALALVAWVAVGFRSGPYVFERYGAGGVVRIERASGDAALLTPDGWLPMRPGAADSAARATARRTAPVVLDPLADLAVDSTRDSTR